MPMPWCLPLETLHLLRHIVCSLHHNAFQGPVSQVPMQWGCSLPLFCCCLLRQGGETHHSRLVSYLLQLGMVTSECFTQPLQACSPTGLGTLFPECWKDWNLMGVLRELWVPWKQVSHEGWFLFGVDHWFAIVACHCLSLRMTSFSSGVQVWWLVGPALFAFVQLCSLGLNPPERGVLNPGLTDGSWGRGSINP